MMRSITGVAAVALSAAFAHATALNLPQGRPDLHASFITITYDYTGQTLTASGFSDQLTLNFTDPSINLPNPLRVWSLTAGIDHTGAFTGVGTLNAYGDYGGMNILLMSGTAVGQFGNSTNLLEFVFTGGGGSQDPLHGNIGVKLSDTSLSFSNASFNVPVGFVNNDDGRADTFLVPAPGAAMLGGMGICCTLGVGRRRRR